MPISKLVPFFATLLLSAAPAWATTYYVDAKSGRDSRNGKSPSNAWKTISKVNKTKFSAGDSILFKRGQTWKEQLTVPSSGTSGKWITYGAYGTGAAPIISGSSTRNYSIYVSGKSYLRFTDLRLQSAKRSGFRAEGSSRYLQFSSVTAESAGQMAGFEFDSADHVDMTSCRADKNRGTSGGGGYGFQFKGGSSNITLINCEASYNLRRGAQFDTGVGGYITIRGGEYHHQYGNNQSDGVSIDDNDQVLIENVWAHDNGSATDDSADGIQVSGGARDPIVRNSLSENNNNAGIVLEVNGGSISYNISRGNRHGIAVGTNDNRQLDIQNNTCYNNEFALFLYQDTPTSPVRAIDNIFYGASDVRRATFLEKGLDPRQISLDDNCLWGDEEKFLVEWLGKLYTRSQYGSYQADTRQDLNSVFADPLFVNAGQGDFHLQAGSPCAGKGRYPN